MRLFRSLVILSALWILNVSGHQASASPPLLLCEGKPQADFGEQDDYCLEPNNQILYHKTGAGWDNGTAIGGRGGVQDGVQLFDFSHSLSGDAGAHTLVSRTPYPTVTDLGLSPATGNYGVYQLNGVSSVTVNGLSLPWDAAMAAYAADDSNNKLYVFYYGGDNGHTP